MKKTFQQSSLGEHICFAIRTIELPDGQFAYTNDFVFARLGNTFALCVFALSPLHSWNKEYYTVEP